MSSIAIRAEGLGKRYKIGPRRPQTTIRESLVGAATAPFRRARALLSSDCVEGESSDSFIWALKGVSFEVGVGEVVGLIGRNGAGKSTLLKILSRITEPTEGVATIRGRVGSLLEVGTGFHPELSGRENIHLSGAIQGMRRSDIRRQFDDIVAFAEVERLIDTPVKHYSSGMYLRLAFAVAAHLEPDVLLVDEVLAVGDIAFQRKCLGKMQQVGHEGRTVLFVSHSMPAVARVCPAAMLLEDGRLKKMGPTAEVVSEYIYGGAESPAHRHWGDLAAAPGNQLVRLVSVRARSEQGHTQDTFDIRNRVGVDVKFAVLQSGHKIQPEVDAYNDEGIHLFCSIDQHSPDWSQRAREAGVYTSTCWIPGDFLAEGTIFIRAALVTVATPLERHAVVPEAIVFHVIDSIDGGSVRGRVASRYPGVVRPRLSWTTVIQDQTALVSDA